MPEMQGLTYSFPRNTMIKPGRNMIPLDIAIELPEWHQAQIEPRSGFSSKDIDGRYFIFENPQTGDRELGELKRWDADVIHGKVDACYRGNIGVIIKSSEKRPFALEAGTKIAQMAIKRTKITEIFWTVNADTWRRGNARPK